MSALRFFYKTTLGKKDAADHIPLARKSDPLPTETNRKFRAFPEAGILAFQRVDPNLDRPDVKIDRFFDADLVILAVPVCVGN